MVEGRGTGGAGGRRAVIRAAEVEVELVAVMVVGRRDEGAGMKVKGAEPR